MTDKELNRLRLRTMDFVIDKNEVVSALYMSSLGWEEASRLETLLCGIVNKFAADMFPGIWDRAVVEGWFKESQAENAECNCQHLEAPPHGCPIHYDLNLKVMEKVFGRKA